jgi:hypothetical protein
VSDLDLIVAFVVSLGLASGVAGALATLGVQRAAHAWRRRAERREIDRQFADIVRRYR